MKKYLLLGIIAASLALVMGCSGGYGSPATKTTTATGPTTTTQAAGGNAVTISGFAFSPATLNVAVGTKVTWTNKDSTTHTVSSDTNAFESGSLASGASYSYTFNTAGTYAYHCSIHTYMKGTVVVK